MVYLVRGGARAPRRGGRYGILGGRYWLYCPVRSCTPADVRVTALHADGLLTIRLADECWWEGWTTEEEGRRLIAMGRVREVSAPELLAIAAGLVVGDDLVIR